MYSLFVGIIMLLVVLAIFWITLGKFGAFTAVSKGINKIKNIFKEEEK